MDVKNETFNEVRRKGASAVHRELHGIKIQTSGVLFWDVANPIYASNEDLMIEETERQILTHNMVGERMCQWSGKKADESA